MVQLIGCAAAGFSRGNHSKLPMGKKFNLDTEVHKPYKKKKENCNGGNLTLSISTGSNLEVC